MWSVPCVWVMSDRGSSVTLILYSIDSDWYKGTEPFLNLVAAAAQRSAFTHVELAIGEGAGQHGEMVNVLRVFNDSTGVVSQLHNLPCAALTLSSSPTPLDGTLPPRMDGPQPASIRRVLPFCIAQELTQRTGKNPNYQYVQIGCSQKAVTAMIQFARAQVGKPFSSTGMFRSMVYPRASTGDDWYVLPFKHSQRQLLTHLSLTSHSPLSSYLRT